VRKEIQKEIENRALFTDMKAMFNSQAYHPHITIGYVGGDVFKGKKDKYSCIAKLKFK